MIPLRLSERMLLVWLFLLLLFGAYQGSTSRAQPDPLSLAREKLLDGFRDIQSAESLGVSREASNNLVRNLNVALELQEQANASGSSQLAVLSVNESTSVSTRALSLGNSAQLEGFLRSAEGYGVSIGAAVLTALLGLESHRLNRLLRRIGSRARRVAE